MDICLGTVKLGLPEYGFSSSALDPAFDPIAFLEQAESLGIHRFDTSPRYGHSEEILGKYFRQSGIRPIVSSKIDNLEPCSPETPEQMRLSVESSLRKLDIDALDICYLHQNDLKIISDSHVHEGLQELRNTGLIHHVGASLYTFEECHYALQSGVFDVIQIPVNVCDMSFYNLFVKRVTQNTKFVARSLLLQGALMNRREIASRIKQSNDVITYMAQLDLLASESGLTLPQLALGFAFGLDGLDHHLIGTTCIQNLEQNMRCAEIQLDRVLLGKLTALASPAKTWANPRNW